MELQDVQFEVQDGVGIITMNRPERLNASSSDMTQGMIHILENLTPDVRAIVLTGAGRAFSAGGDVKGMNESLNNPDGRPAWRRSHAEDVVSVAFWNCDRPIIAAVNGHSVGVGLSYACMCDIRIASDKAQFGALWIRRGYMPDGGGTFFLPFILGVPKALELIWTGDIIDAHRSRAHWAGEQGCPPRRSTAIRYGAGKATCQRPHRCHGNGQEGRIQEPDRGASGSAGVRVLRTGHAPQHGRPRGGCEGFRREEARPI